MIRDGGDGGGQGAFASNFFVKYFLLQSDMGDLIQKLPWLTKSNVSPPPPDEDWRLNPL